MTDRRPILVTGSQRSGTTWVGRMVAASDSPPVGFIWEPLSLLHRPGIFDAPIPFWFPYICTENGARFEVAMRDTLSFRYRAGAELRAVRSPKDVARLGRDWARFHRARSRHARPLLKDPIALFSAEWLADTHGMAVVVMIRHPAAFVYSMKKLAWNHPFDHFLKQHLLMRDWLEPFRPEIQHHASAKWSVEDQAILLWRLFHHVILGYRDRRPEWTFLRHEDVSRDPVAVFRRLYRELGLGFGPRAEATIREHSDPANPQEASSPTALKRDSRSNVAMWKGRLSESEIDRIRTQTEQISKEFYGDEDW
jgi:hypothetical protein